MSFLKKKSVIYDKENGAYKKKLRKIFTGNLNSLLSSSEHPSEGTLNHADGSDHPHPHDNNHEITVKPYYNLGDCVVFREKPQTVDQVGYVYHKKASSLHEKERVPKCVVYMLSDEKYWVLEWLLMKENNLQVGERTFEADSPSAVPQSSNQGTSSTNTQLVNPPQSSSSNNALNVAGSMLGMMLNQGLTPSHSSTSLSSQTNAATRIHTNTHHHNPHHHHNNGNRNQQSSGIMKRTSSKTNLSGLNVQQLMMGLAGNVQGSSSGTNVAPMGNYQTTSFSSLLLDGNEENKMHPNGMDEEGDEITSPPSSNNSSGSSTGNMYSSMMGAGQSDQQRSQNFYHNVANMPKSVSMDNLQKNSVKTNFQVPLSSSANRITSGLETNNSSSNIELSGTAAHLDSNITNPSDFLSLASSSINMPSSSGSTAASMRRVGSLGASLSTLNNGTNSSLLVGQQQDPSGDGMNMMQKQMALNRIHQKQQFVNQQLTELLNQQRIMKQSRFNTSRDMDSMNITQNAQYHYTISPMSGPYSQSTIVCFNHNFELRPTDLLQFLVVQPSSDGQNLKSTCLTPVISYDNETLVALNEISTQVITGQNGVSMNLDEELAKFVHSSPLLLTMPVQEEPCSVLVILVRNFVPISSPLLFEYTS